MPTVTIVIPCYNRADELPSCLASVEGQTAADWEAVVVDDGSTDGGPSALVAGLADDRFRIVRHERNRGPGAARNTGFAAASAPLVLPLDSDDELDPRYLERLVPILDGDAGVDCAFTDFQLFGAGSGVLRFGVRDVPELLARQWLPGPGTLMRKTLWERAGGYCESEALRRGNEDWDFYLSAAEAGFVARHVPEPLYRYRVSQGGLEIQGRYDNYLTREFIYDRHRALFDRYGAGRRFLAEGYLTSARSSAQRGEQRRALRLTARSLRLHPVQPAALPIVARSVIPTPLLRLARRMKAGLRAA